MIQEHADKETDDYGRRVMQQRRVKIGTHLKSTYNTFMKNFPETAPEKIKKREHCNRDQYYRKNPLRAISSITERTLYHEDYEP